MNLLEENLEDIIYEASQTENGRDKLWDCGLMVEVPLKRQVPLGSYGVLDLLEVKGFYNREICITVYELKRGELCAKHMMQLCRYLTALKRHLNVNQLPAFRNIDFRGVLIGHSVKNTNDFCFLVNEMGYKIQTFTFSFDLGSSIKFTRSEGWKNTEENLIHTSTLLNNLSTPLDPDYLQFRISKKTKNNG